MKKRSCLAAVLSLSMLLGALPLQVAAAPDPGGGTQENETTDSAIFDYSGYNKGVTVEADPESPTGYTATFVYDEEDSYSGLNGDITKVELYSDCMYLFKYDEQTAGALDPSMAHTPDEFVPGMYPAGGNGDTTYYAEMTQFEDGLWGVRVPLSSGAFVYNFRVTDSDGNQLSRLDDPSNPTLVNSATGIHSLSSLVYVPYNSETMGTGDYADRSVELPRTDGRTGTVETIAYTGAAGDQRGLAVYLPYGYDADRTEPYKILYLSHGASGDQTGNELRWMNEGAVANIMDNLAAEDKIEPYVVVTMNNQDLGWDYDKIWDEQELIMELIESKYNVCDTAEGRAFAGLSMGGFTTSNMYMNHPEDFSYFGIWSYANVDGMTDEVKDKLSSLEKQPHLFLAAGEWDYLLGPVSEYSGILTDMGIEHGYLQVPGAHDWETWQLIYAYAAENFFWKADTDEQQPADPFDYSKYDKGVTVEADPESPTGYTATFVYDEEDSYSGLNGDITKVELYSDCMYLFKYDEQTAGALDPSMAHTPDEFVPGMYPAGGNGDTTYYAEMTQFEDGLWGIRVPLSSGAFVYNFRVTDSDGNQLSRLDDPSNPTLVNSATGIHSLSSMVYIPYNSETMGTGDYADRSVELPRTDGRTGTVETIAYTGAAGDQRGLAVYLPYGYDADRAEPYKILYLSHGASGDQTGNELRWMNEGAVANIMDNLAAEDKIEPYVVVTMNNQDLGWDYDKIWDEQELIMELIESKYNVCDTAEGRAFAGLSMGGITTSNMYMNHIDEFSYYGIWSAANTGGLTEDVKSILANAKDKVHVFTAAGEWDFGLSSVTEYSNVLTELGIKHDHLQVPGAHDWETWQLIYAYAAENFFWKADSTIPGAEDPGDVPPATDKPGTSDPDKGNGNSGGNSSAINTGSKSPGKVNTNSPAAKTGDNLNAGFAAGSAIESLVLLTAVIIIRKKYFSAR